MTQVVRDQLVALYGEVVGQAAFEKLTSPSGPLREASLWDSRFKKDKSREGSGAKAILITYGDQLREPNRAPLRTLAEFCNHHLRGVVNGKR